MLGKIINITIPNNENIPEIIQTFLPEENLLMLKIGSDCLKEGRNAVVGLTQKDIYNKIKEESKEQIQKLEIDLLVEKELIKKTEERFARMYESQLDQVKKQMEQLKKQLDVSNQQLKVYEYENKDLIETEVNKARLKYELLLDEKDRQNQLNREVFDKAVNLINKNSTRSSVAIGDDGENIFESLAETFKDFAGYRIENKAKQSHKGDFHLFFDEFNVLVDSKNYSSSVQKKEVIKIEEDLMTNDNMNFAWMVSLNTNICEYNRFPITSKWITTDVGVKCILFINNLLENKEPKNILRQAWSICNEFMKLTKNVAKEDGILTKYIERDLVIKKQIENLQERSTEIRRSVNACYNVLRHMDNDLIEMLSLVSNEIVHNKFATTGKINEWWESNMEYIGDESKTTSTEIWNKFKREHKEYVAEHKVTVEVFKAAITNIVDSSSYTEKTKKGVIEFIGFKFKEIEIKEIEIKENVKKELPKKFKKVKPKDYYFDEETDNKILQEYDDMANNIMTISEMNNIRPWQVVSTLMRNNIIKKRDDSRGYDIYKQTKEYKQKLENK